MYLPEAILKMYETPDAKATMITVKVIRNKSTSFIIWFMLRIIGPKYFDAMPTCKVVIKDTFPKTSEKYFIDIYANNFGYKTIVVLLMC